MRSKPMDKLHEITEQLKEVGKLELSNTELSDTLEALGGEFEDKALSLINYTQKLDQEAKIVDEEIKRLTARKKSIKSKSESFRDYVRYNMHENGFKKLECPLFSATLSEAQDIVVIDDVDLIPSEFVKIEIKETPDKKAIKEAIKAGVDIPGARLEKGKPVLKLS